MGGSEARHRFDELQPPVLSASSEDPNERPRARAADRSVERSPIFGTSSEEEFDRIQAPPPQDDFSSSQSTGSSEFDQSRPFERLQPAQPDEKRKYVKSPCYRKSGKKVEHKTYPRAFEHPGFEASLPRTWDWRNVSGANYCSPNRNQHIPVYCGSCWVFGSLGALNDRFNIARKNRWPMTMLSPQEIIDCNEGGGSCQGGEFAHVAEHAKKNGLVEEGCNNYVAVNQKCNPYHRCGTCWPEHCDPVTNYTRYFIKDYGEVSGRANMMAEIHARGPIACSIGATSLFEFNYTTGIYHEFSDLPSNHIVSVSGWGFDEESKLEYWIVRNSGGNAWGETGWFRVVTSLYLNGRGDHHNMGIERDCYYADVDLERSNLV
ncbi:Cathepsin X [Aphelenchoides fujianensis]|nr:Cathepsin X [Aphelenchoides fujianensis]